MSRVMQYVAVCRCCMNRVMQYGGVCRCVLYESCDAVWWCVQVCVV